MSNPFVPRDASLESPAQHEESVKGLYQDQGVAENYIRNRFAWAWSRLLHESQIRILNDVIRANSFQTALEIAPGPARIAPDLTGLRSGIMVEASEPMIEVARRRLAEKDLERVWEIRHGNAFDLAPLGRTFDFAFTFRFLRHFEERERLRLYQEIAGRLNPSGLLVFDVVNKPIRAQLDALKSPTPSDALPVYDVTYTAPEFREEMRASGFEVAALHPLVRRFRLQSWLSYTVGPRIPWLAWALVNAIEMVPARDPLEWVAVCRKLGGN